MKKPTFPQNELSGVCLSQDGLSISVTKNENGSFDYYLNGEHKGAIAAKHVPAFAAIVALTNDGLLTEEQRKVALVGTNWKLIDESMPEEDSRE